MISSNDTQSRMIFTTLTVKAADGTDVCNVSVETQMVTNPAIYPLQFRITYPTRSIDIPIPRGTRKYTIYGRFTIEGNPEQTSITNDKNEWTFEFPGAGNPACVNMLN